MNGRMVDVAIVGGGLAGGLAALAMHRARPDLRQALIEKGKVLGGNHRWSWFASDLSPVGDMLLAPFRKTEWEPGYEVRFPQYRRALNASYRSLASSDFDAALRRELPPGTILAGHGASALDQDGVTLDNGTRIPARTVIDCRSFEPSAHLSGGWQIFMGRHLRTPELHGVAQPIIMDAAVKQHSAYRFVYTLPLSAHGLFVEDTYYADAPQLDRSALSGRIDEYCRSRGWDGEILGNETGVLPVITGGDFAAYRAEIAIPGVAAAGARGGFSHPLTSYTLPIAVDNALAIAREADLTGSQMAAFIETRARRHWKQMKFYRQLGRMLFDAAEPDARYRIFQRFYRLPEPLVERFYAGESTFGDRARILVGRPPVSILRAVSALAGKGTPLYPPQPLRGGKSQRSAA